MVTRLPSARRRRVLLLSPGAWAAAVFVLALALLQTSVLPYFEILGARPALVMVSVVILATTHPDSRALLWGFGGGLLVDLFSAAPLGLNAAIFSLLAFAAGSGGRALDRTQIIFPAIATAVATVVYYPTVLAALQALGFRIDWTVQLADRIVPAVAANLLAGAVLYPFVRQLAKWTRPPPTSRFKGVK